MRHEPEEFRRPERNGIHLAGQERTIELVGSDEADPAAGRVAFTAPLAVALTGLMAGETGDFASKRDAIEVIDTRAIEA